MTNISSKKSSPARTKASIAPDPFAQREAEKYENPVPSREFILSHLEQREGPANHTELCRELDLTEEEQIEALRRRLIAMVRDGQIRCGRNGAFGPIDKLHLVRGRIQGHQDGFGFLIPEDGSNDIFLNSLQMTCAFDGDIALVRETGKDYRGRRNGKVVDVIEHNTHQVVGRYREESGIGFVIPDNKRIPLDVVVPPGKQQDANSGDIVTVKILEQPRFRKQPVGEVIEVLGQHMAPGMEIDIALRRYEIPHTWPDEVTSQAQSLPTEVQLVDKTARVDLTNVPLVTIDGEDARDFDDAVFAEPLDNGHWRLVVAIADVSHYVKPGSELDKEAHVRGTSVYFPEQVVPMLPEALSNGLCSLNPKVERLSMVCDMTIGPEGVLEDYEFYEAVIYSHARLTYTKVAEMLLEPDSLNGQKWCTEYAEILPHLHSLYGLYQVLRIARNRRGAIDFETEETRIIFDDQRKIEQIVPVVRNEAHKLIEECMLCANVCAAEFVTQHQLPALFRVHDGPSMEKLEKLRSYLGELGLDLGGGLKPTPMHYQKLLKQIEQREDAHLLQTVLLRSMSQAVYQPENIGHFGLGYEAYAHFTSPIRRYPDLLIHRAIRSMIQSKQPSNHLKRLNDTPVVKKEQHYPYDMKQMVSLGEHCSLTERRADEATWDVVAWLKCEYMQDHLGEEFIGTVASVAPFGLFITLDEIYVEGLVHVTSLKSDYYQYDDEGHRLIGERTRTVYGLGDKLKVQVVRVDLDERKIDFEMLGDHRPARGARAGLPKKGKPKKAKGADKKSSTASPAKKKKAKAKGRSRKRT